MSLAVILPGGVAALLLLAHIASIVLSSRFVSFGRRGSGRGPGGVSLVRPLCGIDFDGERLLRASFAQEIENFEVIFCVARDRDPVVPLVRRLIAEHPAVRASLLIGDQAVSPNPKLNNMAKGWAAARYDTVVFADSNLLLPPDYCARVREAFAPGVAVVSSPPVGTDPRGFWGEVECAMLNTHAARWQYAAASLGICFAQGKTLAFRKSGAPAHLMRLLGEEPAEDAAATKLARAMAGRVALIAPPFSHPVGARGPQQVWKRHSRWAKLRRATFPLLFAGEILTGSAPALCAAGLAAWFAGLTPAAIALPGLVLWYLPEAWLAWRCGWVLSLASPVAWLTRDCLLPAIYVAAWANDEFVWNGHRMTGAKATTQTF